MLILVLVILEAVQPSSSLSCPINCSCSIDVVVLNYKCVWSSLRGIYDENHTTSHVRSLVMYVEFTNVSEITESIFNSFKKLTHLYIQGEQLTSLKDSLFHELVNLERLTIKNTSIHRISKKLFSNLKNLKMLEIIKNKMLTSINEFAFFDTIKLNQLNLNANSLQRLDKKLFSRIPNLVSLYLAKNNLTSIDFEIFSQQRQLRILRLSENKISVLKGQTNCSLKMLTYLHLDRNKLPSIPGNFLYCLSNLQKIRLDKNIISNFPHDIFTSLTRIHEINLSTNKLKIISKNLFLDLTTLRVLDLSFNKLKRINNMFFLTLTNLEKLKLQNNNINTIQRNSFNPLKRLFYLDLSNNHVEFWWHDIFSNLTKLKYLYLRNCTFSKLETEYFYRLKQLNEIDLSFNKINNVSQIIFRDLILLRRLYLNDNEIGIIQNNTFSLLKGIQKIYLQNNRLTVLDTNMFAGISKLNGLPANIFCGLNNLVTLDMSKNYFKTFNRDFLTCLFPNKIKLALNLQDNPIQCSLYFRTFIEELYNLDHGTGLVINANCISNGETFDTISLISGDFLENWKSYKLLTTIDLIRKKEDEKTLLIRKPVDEFAVAIDLYLRVMDGYVCFLNLSLQYRAENENVKVGLSVEYDEILKICYTKSYYEICSHGNVYADGLYSVEIYQLKTVNGYYSSVFVNGVRISNSVNKEHKTMNSTRVTITSIQPDKIQNVSILIHQLSSKLTLVPKPFLMNMQNVLFLALFVTIVAILVYKLIKEHFTTKPAITMLITHLMFTPIGREITKFTSSLVNRGILAVGVLSLQLHINTDVFTHYDRQQNRQIPVN